MKHLKRIDEFRRQNRNTAVVMLLITVSIITFGLPGCQPSDCAGNALGRDQLRLQDTLENNGNNYHLYTRTTGFQEKVVYLELYDAAPVFDKCQRPDGSPVFETAYNNYPVEQYIQSIVLQPDDAEILAITYTQNKDEAFPDVYLVKFNR